MTWLSHHRFQNVFCPRKNEMCFRKCFRKAPFRAWLISVHGWSNRSRATFSTFLRHYFGQGLNRLLIAQNGSKYYFSSRLSILQSTYDQVNFVVPLVFTWTHAEEFWMRPKKKPFWLPLSYDTWEEWKETGCLIDTIFILIWPITTNRIIFYTVTASKAALIFPR